MKKLLFILCCALTIASCKEQGDQKLGEISYNRGGDTCNYVNKKYWLIDITSTDANDSVYLNTNDLNRKVELSKSLIDTASNVFKLISQTCIEDFVELKLSANEFYTSLGGVVPLTLEKEELITVKIWVRDVLNPFEYLAHKRAYEDGAIKRFIEQNRWNGSLDSTTGIYYEYLNDFKDTETDYQKAEIEYSITSINRDLIAFSKEGDPLIFDVDDQSILPGIRFLVSQLTEGESIRAVVPSSQAFGPEGNSKVAGYTPILVELKMLKIIE